MTLPISVESADKFHLLLTGKEVLATRQLHVCFYLVATNKIVRMNVVFVSVVVIYAATRDPDTLCFLTLFALVMKVSNDSRCRTRDLRTHTRSVRSRHRLRLRPLYTATTDDRISSVGIIGIIRLHEVCL